MREQAADGLVLVGVGAPLAVVSVGADGKQDRIIDRADPDFGQDLFNGLEFQTLRSNLGANELCPGLFAAILFSQELLP